MVSTNHGDIPYAAISLFQIHLGSKHISRCSEIIQVIPHLVNDDDNLYTLRPPTLEGVVVDSILADSTFGLDGFSSIFFSSCWDFVKQ